MECKYSHTDTFFRTELHLFCISSALSSSSPSRRFVALILVDGIQLQARPLYALCTLYNIGDIGTQYLTRDRVHGRRRRRRGQQTSYQRRWRRSPRPGWPVNAACEQPASPRAVSGGSLDYFVVAAAAAAATVVACCRPGGRGTCRKRASDMLQKSRVG